MSDFFVCTPAKLIDRSLWERHEHTFDPKDDDDKERAKQEAAECHRRQCEKLGLEPEV